MQAMQKDAMEVVLANPNITVEERDRLIYYYTEHLLPFRNVMNGTAPNRNLRTKLGDFLRRLEQGNSEDWGSYLFLESKLFDEHPNLWRDFIKPIPQIINPLDFSPPQDGERNKRKSMLISAPGSRSNLHMDPYGWTSWIAMISGIKPFRTLTTTVALILILTNTDHNRSSHSNSNKH